VSIQSKTPNSIRVSSRVSADYPGIQRRYRRSGRHKSAIL
jgi:hypothetical protein